MQTVHQNGTKFVYIEMCSSTIYRQIPKWNDLKSNFWIHGLFGSIGNFSVISFSTRFSSHRFELTGKLMCIYIVCFSVLHFIVARWIPQTRVPHLFETPFTQARFQTFSEFFSVSAYKQHDKIYRMIIALRSIISTIINNNKVAAVCLLLAQPLSRFNSMKKLNN